MTNEAKSKNWGGKRPDTGRKQTWLMKRDEIMRVPSIFKQQISDYIEELAAEYLAEQAEQEQQKEQN